MPKTRKPSPTEQPLLIEIDPEPLPETLTALGGVPLVVQTFRSLGLPVSVRQHVQVKQRERGCDEATMVESFVILNAVGGECFEDFQRLREDPGLSEMIGHGIPSPEAARQFLYQFHEEEKIEEAKQGRSGEGIAYIPEESEALKGLGWVRQALVQELGRRCPDQRIATVDQDARIIECRKQEALRTYEGERGYQPMLAVWAEMSVVLADEFRDGNVPAMMDPLSVAKRAFAALPETVTTYYYRGDSASHESHLVNWLRDEKRAEGPQGRIGFAISARMSEALKKAIEKLPEEAWEPYGRPHPVEMRECAQVSFVPGGTNAAWLRLAAISHNVMTALKRLALPAELLTARPKRLRFLIFNTPGRLVHHARRLVLRWATTAARLAEWLEALKLLPLRA